MKHLIVICSLIISAALSVNAQTRTETFDSNTMGWTEVSDKHSEAVIRDGELKIRSGKWTGLFGRAIPSSVESHCYSGLDYNKDFSIVATAKAKKMTKKGWAGIVLNYTDDGNMLLFAFNKKHAYLINFVDGRINGRMVSDIKFPKKKNAPLEIEVKNESQSLFFYVNDVQIFERRYLPLISDGVGFYAEGKQRLSIDEVKFIQ